MGTRHLIAVSTGNDYPIAQYGQWDGYPDGQGIDVLDFCVNLNDETFRKGFELGMLHTKDVKELTEGEFKTIEETIEADPNWTVNYPQLSRDAGAKILNYVYEARNSTTPIPVKRYLEFAADSLFCEWAYVIDMKHRRLEVYKGFNKNPLDKNERFYGIVDKENIGGAEYQPVRFLVAYDFDKLPSKKDFVKEVNKLAGYEED